MRAFIFNYISEIYLYRKNPAKKPSQTPNLKQAVHVFLLFALLLWSENSKKKRTTLCKYNNCSLRLDVCWVVCTK